MTYKIGFFARKCLPVDADTLEHRPLGGTETGLIRLADALAKRGHQISVFSSDNKLVDRKMAPSNPTYLHFRNLIDHPEMDIFVSVKEWQPAFFGVKCKKLFFWSGDGADQYANFGIGDKRVARRINLFLSASKWHQHTFCEQTNFPLLQSQVLGNGVHSPYFASQVTRQSKRLIYSSPPYRGLALALPIYLELKKKHADLEFHIFSGMQLYHADKPYQGPEAEESNRVLQAFKDVPGCFMHGNILQKDLAIEFMRSALFFYPNIVAETCCISALEAQAAGCAVVTSHLGALTETVGDSGFCIAHPPGSDAYNREFIQASDAILSNSELFSVLSNNALSRISRNYTWERVADRFEEICSNSVAIN